MEEMDADHLAIRPLQAVFGGAKAFGLTEAEVWQTVDECLYEAGGDATVSEYLDELIDALAQRILYKERRALSEKRRVLSEELL
ncbi:MAG: hypothetical protein ACRDPC_07710 [Solirubrobacteraceae bacterium]